MTDQEYEEVTALLHARKADLTQQVHGTHERSKPVSLDDPIGRLSRMDALQQQQMADAAKRRLAGELDAVERALDRVEGGTYGECPACGEDIDIRRLRVRPATVLCLTCQTQRER